MKKAVEKMGRVGLLGVCASVLMAGCVPAMAPVGTSTVRVAATREADVLWLFRDDALLRCTVNEGKPACAAASGLTQGSHAGVGSFTLQVSEEQDADVVWVLSSEILHRCTGEGGKPVCTAAAGP